MAQQFRVIISGRSISGAPLAASKDEAGRAFRLEGELLDRMFSGKPMVVSRKASEESAQKLLARLRALDMEARMEALESVVEVPAVAPPPIAETPVSDELFALAPPPVKAVAASVSTARPSAPAGATPLSLEAISVPADGTACPKCGEVQPVRTLCRQCGLDMPRYRAAQAAVEEDERQARMAEVAARKAASRLSGGKSDEGDGVVQSAALLGISFSGRFGRLDYLSASLFYSLVWLLLVWLAASTGKMALGGLGLVISVIFTFRCLALRLHDTGRTGWLSLLVVVPVIGVLMALALLFIRGEDDDNEYGLQPTYAGGGRAIAMLLVTVLLSGLIYRDVGQTPEKMLKFVVAMSGGRAKALAEAAASAENDAEDPAEDRQSVRYASNNRIDIYVVAGCSNCDRMRAWLNANSLHYTVYAVDSDEQAAARLQSIIAGNGGAAGRVMLPVLEVNGRVLPGDPDIGQVHARLHQMPAES